MEKSQKQRAITRMPCVKTWLYWFMLPFPVCFVVHGRMMCECALGRRCQVHSSGVKTNKHRPDEGNGKESARERWERTMKGKSATVIFSAVCQRRKGRKPMILSAVQLWSCDGGYTGERTRKRCYHNTTSAVQCIQLISFSKSFNCPNILVFVVAIIPIWWAGVRHALPT